jgi:hypothetical protein
MGFAAGEEVTDPSNETNALSVGSNAATEVEYALALTTNATANAYCFRTTNGGTDLDSYDQVAEVQVQHPPFISSLALNSNADIALTEGTTTNISASCTVTDQNGYTDIVSATSTLYRSGVGAACSPDENNCYQMASSSCAFSSCAGDSCTLTCTAPMQYFADPTDVGSAYAAQNWLASVGIQDSTGLRDTASSSPVDVLTLYGLTLSTGGIDFGALAPGGNTGGTNATTTIINTGNANINIQLSGTDLSSGASVIPVGEQKYATSTFVYGSCSVCQFLTGSATNVNVNLNKPTSTSTPSTGDVYWGIDVPLGSQSNTYAGVNTFTAVGG